MAGEVYDLPLRLQPKLKEYALGQSPPVAEELCARHACLPAHSDRTEDEIDDALAAARSGERGERACASR
jgi:hypothetical protein